MTDVLAAVVRAEPDWNALPADAPPRIRELLRRCMTKDVKQRPHDIADARLEVDDAIGRAAEPQPVAGTSEPFRRRERLAWAATVVALAAALVALGALGYLGRGFHQPSPEVTRSLVSVAPADQLLASNPSEAQGKGRPSRTAMVLSPDGRTLAYIEGPAAASYDVMALSLDGDRRPKPILATPSNESYPEFSPDGRYLAYTSNASGRNEVYVQPYPGPGPRQQISNEGGFAPASPQDRRELFYVMSTGSAIRMIAVPITTTPSLTAETARMLFEGRYFMQSNIRGYDVTADGQRFYFTQTKERPPIRATQMILVQNWFEELKAKVPTGRPITGAPSTRPDRPQ